MNKKTSCLLVIFITLNACVNAQLQEVFTPRYSQSMGGDMTMIANNMVSIHPTQDYNGENDNNEISSVYVDIDNDDSTFNSSSANFTSPELEEPCIAILKAFLYWSAADKGEIVDGIELDNQLDWNYFDIKLMLPGETDYTIVRADEVVYRGRDEHFINDPYVCFKDISENVKALGSGIYGKYQIANVEAKIGGLVSHFSSASNVGTSAGWQIVFIYSSPELPPKNITLFDGYAHVTRDRNTFPITFNGFLTAPNGPVRGNILFGALEGDRGITGDRLQIENVNGIFENIVAASRPEDNFFNSRITKNQPGDDNFIDRNPASLNTLGFDAGVFRFDNRDNSIFDNETTSATIRMTSTGETYGLYALGLSIDVKEPNLYPTITSSTITDPVESGSMVSVDFNIINKGVDDAVNVIIASQLPDQVTLANPPILPEGITYTYNTTDNSLVFEVENDVFTVNSPTSVINIELKVKEECYFIEQNSDLEIRIEFETEYNGTVNPTAPKTASSSIDPNTCLATPFLIEVIQPELSWATLAGDLDIQLDCGDIMGLEDAQNLAPVLDRCDPLQVNVIKDSGELVPDSACDDAGKYINTWTFEAPTSRRIESYTQTITVGNTLGINSPEFYKFTHFVNSRGILVINSSEELISASVYNLLGQELITRPLSSSQIEIDLSNLNSNMIYIVYISGSEGQTKSIKVVK